jgi:two-component system, cell cycle sensor histidine kinase and response regulator CckA
VAHDFNNILTVIQGHVSFLLESAVHEPDVAESLNELKLAADRASNLTRQLLTFSRRQVLQVKPLDLNEVLENLGKMLRRLLGEHITLQLHYAPESAWIEADMSMMEQVIMNLSVNARDAMPAGGQLTISTAMARFDDKPTLDHPDGRQGHFIALCVEDTGTGMDRAVLKRLFEPFFTTKKKGQGTGLGLATIYGIVKQHRGWIEVESAVGKGSRFTLFLPVCEKTTVSRATINSAGLQVKGGQETILLVEDEASVRVMCASCLRKYGYQVLEAGTGAEALYVWEHHGARVDLLLTDLVMPGGMTGYELASKLRKEKGTLKIMYCSGYNADASGEDEEVHQRTFFLSKPYEPSRLAKLVRECLDSASA